MFAAHTHHNEHLRVIISLSEASTTKIIQLEMPSILCLFRDTQIFRQLHRNMYNFLFFTQCNVYPSGVRLIRLLCESAPSSATSMFLYQVYVVAKQSCHLLL